MTFQELKDIQEQYNAKHKHVARVAYPIAATISITFIVALLIAIVPKINFSSLEFHESLPTIIPMAIVFLIILIITFAIATAIVSYKTRSELNTYKKAYKSYFVAASFQKIFQNIEYHHDQGIPRETVAKIMYSGDRYHSNDLTIANYKGLNFTQADVHTEEKHEEKDQDGDTTTYYVTVFRGRFLIFDFNRNFTYNMQLSSKGFSGETLPISSSPERKFEHLKTESSDFNRSFSVYAQDGVDALYILDPSFMEKIQKLYADCGCEIMITFMDKKVYFAINDGKDSFEIPNPKTPIDEKTEFAKIAKDIQVITDFVDHLSLDRYIFKSNQ